MRASMSMESAVLVLAAVVLMAVAVPVASAEQLSGRVEWKTRGSTRPAQAVVYAEPLDRTAPTAAGKGTLQHKNKTFLPHVVAVPAGSTIAFPNDDPIFHNAFSLSSPQPFDMGLYRAGVTKQQVFTRPGVAGQDGAWRLDVPAGRYRVTALSERAAPVTVEVSVSGAAASADGLVLDESAFVSTEHLNKFGKPYPRDAYKPQP